MKRLMQAGVFVVCSISGFNSALAKQFDTSVPMTDKGIATYYVAGEIAGYGTAEFMVDTGSGYMTINEQTLMSLLARGEAEYVKLLEAVLADGQRTQVPVYSLSAVNIGGQCWVNNVEAAVFPGETRQILGLSALKTVSPFIFSFDPPELILSHCGTVHQTSNQLN